MKKRRFSAIPAGLLAAALVCGCEWTGSSDSSSWSSAYDNMNFSGTYRSTSTAASNSNVTTSSDSSETTTYTPVQQSESATAAAGEKSFSGKFAHVPRGASIVAGTVNITIGDFGFTDDGSNGLNGGSAGSGSYDNSGWRVTLARNLANAAPIKITYTVSVPSTSAASSVSTSTGEETVSTSVSAITVSQNGQNLTIRFNNGIQMDGKFTAVNLTSGTAGESDARYNAQFEVKSGSDSKFVGTLNYDTSTGYRTIDGSWTWGKGTYDIHGVGPAY